MSVKIEHDLKEILCKIDQKLDGLQKDIVDLQVGQTKIKALGKRVKLLSIKEF